MTSKMRKEKNKPYIVQMSRFFFEIAFILLIIAACIAIGANVALLHKTHQAVMNKTDLHISELSQSISNDLERGFQGTFSILESAALSFNQDNMLWDDELEELQEWAERLQFEYFAFISADGSAVCTDGVSRTFARQDGVMKAFEGQPVIDVEISETEANEQKSKRIFFAVPVYSHKETEEITGVLTAPILPLWADSFLTQSYYSGDVFLDIIRSDGTEVFVSNRSHVSQFDALSDSDTGNLFDTLEANVVTLYDTTVDDLREAAATGRNEIIRFHLLHNDLIQTAQLTRIGDMDLCIWMVDTNGAMSEGIDPILHKAFWVNSLGVVCFCILLIILVHLYRKNSIMLMVDPTTGGYSLFRFNHEAERLLHNSTPGDYMFISINIVNFKFLNDAYGYYESNRVLKYIHNTFRKHLKDGEILVRPVVDEFNLLVHTIPNEQLLQKLALAVDEINRFNDELSEKQWLMLRAGVYQITDTSLPVIYIRDRANMARKKSKKTIKRVLYSCGFYDEEDRCQIQQENVLKNKMYDALKNQDFKMFLQSKVDISSGKVCSAEALIRWKDADMGLVPPDEFIPLFEKIGFIRKLDLYMFEQACICLRRWLDAGVQPVPISVNLSRTHLDDKDFLAPFVKVQKKYCVPSELLELELTETAFQDYQDGISDAIHQIHNAGYACSLDDFGSGYSSLNNLEALDIDVLKLDCKFLRAARTKNDKGHIVIEELIHMAHSLGIAVCCEGVETEEQRTFLEECHCDKGQGYLFSKPIEAAAFEELVYGTALSQK